MGDVEPLCEGLSQHYIESVSVFRADVNMYRAEQGQEAIELSVAMKFLKAARYNSCKALDIYKNYNKYKDTYQLESLKSHKEPLCSEIASKKMEIMGTYDTEGSPLIVYNGSKHDSKQSDPRASTQLLFHVLDQASQSEHTQDVGVVFLLDMRDVSANFFVFFSNLVSILKDGYPLYMKSIYIINPPQAFKKTGGFARTLKQEADRIKIVTPSDLLLHFPETHLPLSLGGSYVSAKECVYPHHSIKKVTSSIARNQIHVQKSERSGPTTSPQHSPILPSLPPAVNGNKSKMKSGHRTVTSLARVFESKSPEESLPETTADRSSYPQGKTDPAPHTKPLPQTPPQSSKTKPHPGQGKQNAYQSTHKPLLPSKTGPPTPPTKPGAVKQGGMVSETTTETNEKVFLKSPKLDLHKEAAGKGLSRSHSSRNAAAANGKLSPNCKDSAQGISDRIRNLEASGVICGTPSTGTVESDKKAQLQKSGSEDPLSIGRHAHTSTDRGRMRADSDGIKLSPKNIKKPRVPVKFLGGEDKEPENEYDQPTRTSPHVQQKHFKHMHSQPSPSNRGVKMERKYENCDIGKQADKPTNSSEYENVEITGSRHSRVLQSPMKSSGYDSSTVHTPSASGKAGAYESPSKGEYENITLLPKPSPSGGVATSNGRSGEYEVVNFSGTSHEERVDNYPTSDDETLFGQDGPPGLQAAIYENFGPDVGNKLMSVDELDKHVRSKGKDGLSVEYLKIKNEPLCGPYTSCKLKYNLTKNRYKDVVCYEETRVKLKVLKGVEGSDYIHANYVTGYNKPEAFVLTQGPKDKTVCDFWRLVWEKQIHVIVMITKCVELLKRKCALYWPEECGTVIKHRKVSVEVLQTNSHNDYEQRTLKIISKGVERIVTHYQFVAWPDYGVPESGLSVLDLLFAVRDTQSKTVSSNRDTKEFKHLPPYGPPILVHCSAGVGRSGAFCAIDNAIDELKDKNKVNLQGIVRKMRLQRAYTVQTDEQYEFCYRTLLEYAKSHR